MPAIWCAVFACGANAANQNASALDCTFSNIQASPWTVVTPLTNATPVGATLYRRGVSLYVSYKYGGSSETAHELVTAGHWQSGSLETVPTNVDGIGFKWAGATSEGVEHTVPQAVNPIALAKSAVLNPGGATTNTIVSNFRQYLILEKPPSQLPPGELVVNNLPGNPTVALYAIDFPAGVASVGGAVSVPGATNPPDLCNKAIRYTGAGNLTIGGGGPIPVPNTCEVQSGMIVPVSLGNIALNRFASVNATSQPVDFSITLNQCAAAAKPTISFRDKAAQPNPDKTLLQLSAPGGQAVARGFNIVMTNTLTGERIAYDEPNAAPPYPMKRVGDTAVMPLRAQYIRTGADGELKAGYAGGAAEFTFTFP
ncbi:fimbrial protein [Burkholderia catarinensis]|uniref:fimbrial protein n=1 Tax=Burkholderia catarinensis TaxID=1108140 RepID=UPI001FE95EF1|nr:fimbrial protein [Burkholderia catarinensis]